MTQEEEDGERSWFQYRRLVLNELESLKKDIEGLGRKIEKHNGDSLAEIGRINVKVAMLEVKAGAWGALAGIVMAVITSLIVWAVKLH